MSQGLGARQEQTSSKRSTVKPCRMSSIIDRHHRGGVKSKSDWWPLYRPFRL